MKVGLAKYLNALAFSHLGVFFGLVIATIFGDQLNNYGDGLIQHIINYLVYLKNF